MSAHSVRDNVRVSSFILFCRIIKSAVRKNGKRRKDLRSVFPPRGSATPSDSASYFIPAATPINTGSDTVRSIII